MTIAFDIDGTWDRDWQMWLALYWCALKNGHTCIFVTGRAHHCIRSAPKSGRRRAGGRPRGPATERINWRLPVGAVAGIERLANADGLTGPEYLAALAGVQNASHQATASEKHG